MKYAMGSLRFSLSEEGAPYYQQLMDQVRQGIESGELMVGDKLPSSRALAESLGVSRSTTSRAYEQLVAEGFLVSEEKRGVFVAVSTAMRTESVPARASIQPISDEEILRLDSGVDVEAFPNKEWAASMRRSWLNPDLAVLRGDYSTGFPDLKAAIVDYLYRVRGMCCSPEQVIVTAGSRDSLTLIQHTLSAMKTDIQWWAEEAAYPPMRETLSHYGSVKSLSLDDEGACVQDKAEGCNVALLTANRQYPLGMSMSSSRRQQWIQTLQNTASDWWLIDDDYDNEFVYQGRGDVPLTQTASMHDEARDRVFFVGSFSKVLFRGLRLGFIVAPLAHIEQLKKTQRLIGVSASQPIQPAVADFMRQGGFDRHINRMRRHYRIKRDVLLEILEKHLVDWCFWKKPRGGMHVLIELKEDVIAAQSEKYLDEYIAQKLEQENVRISTLSSHYADDRTFRQGFVLGFSGPTENNMLRVIERLAACLSNHLI